MPPRSASCRSFVVVAVAIGMSEQALAQSRFERISVSSAEVEANGHIYSGKAIVSADGRYVALDSYASNLAPYDLNNTTDVFVRDRQLGTTVLISTALTGLSANNSSGLTGMSSDGRFVVFRSNASDLVKFDTNQQTDVFVRDRDPDGNGVFDEGNETTVRVNLSSSGAEAQDFTYGGSISDDGTRVVFTCEDDNLVAGDSNGASDVFFRDLTTGVTEIVSLSTQGVQGNSGCGEPLISLDGNVVCFPSVSTNLVSNDQNGRQDLFVRDLASGTTTRVSVRSDGGESNGDANEVSMSGDGQQIVFWSHADNLVAPDTNFDRDAFMHDRATATTTMVSVSATGVQGDRASYSPRLSSNGQFIVFSSSATNLAGIETNNSGDVFLVDLATGGIRKISVHESGREGNNGTFGNSISDDGLIVALYANGFDLIGGDSNGIQDDLVRNLAFTDPEASWTNYGAGWPGTLGVPTLTSTDPVLGTTVQVQIGNSLGFYAVGFLLLGFDDTSIQTSLGGTILVDSLILQAILLDPNSTNLSGLLPLDDNLVGVSLFLQVLEMDAGASHGVSFTPGLELVFGQ